MNRLASLLAVALLAAISFAARADYKILFLNSPDITIGSQQLRVGDSFAPGAAIQWSQPQQAMKVLDSETGHQRLVVAEQYTRSRVDNLARFFAQTRHLSSRDGAPDNPISLGAALNGTFFFTDTLEVATAMPTDADRFFYVSYVYNGEEINKLVPCNDGTFSISSEIFTIDGKAIPPFRTFLTVYYLDRTAEQVIMVTDRMEIVLLPTVLHDES